MSKSVFGPSYPMAVVAALMFASAAHADQEPAAAPVPVPKAGEPVPRIGVPTTKPMMVFVVDVRWLGSSPYRIEHEITSRIEQALKGIPDLREMHSTVTGSRAQTLLYFDAKVDASSVATVIRNKLDQIRTRLPHGASQPLISWRREPPLP